MSDHTPAAVEFRTVEDLHRVPIDKIQAFTTDLALWLQLHRLVDAHGLPVTGCRDVFGWVDDGRHDVTLTINGLDVPLQDGEKRRPTWAECGKCRYRWIAAFVPMPADLFAKVCKRATCASCGETRRLYLYEPGKTPEVG